MILYGYIDRGINMKKLFGFLFIVLLIILIIFFSNRYYSKKTNKNLIDTTKDKVDVIKHKTVDLDELENGTIKTKDKTKEEVKEEKTEEVEVKDNTTTTNTQTTNASVPNTASDDDYGYKAVERYEVTFNKSNLNVGDSGRIKVDVYPSDASEKEVLYTSKTPSTCSVSSMGKVKALNSGDCIISINVKNSKTHKLLININ